MKKSISERAVKEKKAKTYCPVTVHPKLLPGELV